MSTIFILYAITLSSGAVSINDIGHYSIQHKCESASNLVSAEAHCIPVEILNKLEL